MSQNDQDAPMVASALFPRAAAVAKPKNHLVTAWKIAGCLSVAAIAVVGIVLIAAGGETNAYGSTSYLGPALGVLLVLLSPLGYLVPATVVAMLERSR